MMLFMRLDVTNGCQGQYQGRIMHKLKLKMCLKGIDILVFFQHHILLMCVLLMW